MGKRILILNGHPDTTRKGGTRAEEVLGRALKGRRRESLQHGRISRAQHSAEGGRAARTQQVIVLTCTPGHYDGVADAEVIELTA